MGQHGYMFIRLCIPFRGRSCTQPGSAKKLAYFLCPLRSLQTRFTPPPLPDFVPVHTRLQFEQSARKGGARYRRIPDIRFPPAASRACRSCGVATKPGPLAEAEACTGGGEAQSRRSRRARLWAPGGGVRATRVRGRLGARRHPPGPSVCLPTNCHRSAATHSDALNKRPALAICFPLPRRAQAAWSRAHRRDPQSANTGSESAQRLQSPCSSPRPLAIPGSIS